MLSSGTLRAQIASIIDVLAKAAVAEIAKVVEDGMVVLRLEMVQRDSEIDKLKSSIDVLHSELRTAQQRTTVHPDEQRVRDGELLLLVLLVLRTHCRSADTRSIPMNE